MKLFGFQFGKKKTEELETVGNPKEDLQGFGIPRESEGDILVPEIAGEYGYMSWALQAPSEQADLIKSYRELAESSEIDEALDELRNEVFVFDIPDKKAVDVDFKEETDLSDAIQKKIQEEFDYLYEMIEFDHRGTQYFDDWYVDSMLCVHKIINKSKPAEGIKKIELIDPLMIRRVRVFPEPNVDGTYNLNEVKEFFVYGNYDNKRHPMSRQIDLQYNQSIEGLRIHPDSVTFVKSGLWDRSLRLYVGYLKKAIVPYNNLKLLEDAMVIFRVVRAPARRAIYIDVSGLPKGKSEEYIKKMMARYRNKMTYDSRTGTLSDRRQVMSMLEDYWLPRRSEGRTTEIQSLEGQNSTDIMEEVEYQRDKLWRALGVPRGRFGDQASSFLFGKGVEIQRDEYRFTKFISRLRQRFIVFFEDLLKTQLVLKKIISEKDWDEVRHSIQWKFAEDNNFVEYKDSQVWASRFETIDGMQNVIGKYVSPEWVATKILRMTKEEFEEQQKKIKAAREESPHLFDIEPPEEDFGGGFGGQQQEPVQQVPSEPEPKPEPKEEDDK